MTIDEAIAHAREKAKLKKQKYVRCPIRTKYNCKLCSQNPKCKECSEEHEQLAEWLEDYRRIKMLVPIEQALKAEYIKAIDDFYNALADDLIWIKERFGDDVYTDLWCDVGTRAEQLKAGGGNEE